MVQVARRTGGNKGALYFKGVIEQDENSLNSNMNYEEKGSCIEMTVESLLERIFRGKFKIEWATKRAIKIDQLFFRLAFFHLLKPETAVVYIEDIKKILDGYKEELESLTRA